MDEISVIIVSFNRPKTLYSVIDTYLEQKYVAELIIVDDGSTKSYEVVYDHCQRECCARGIRFIYHRNEKNCGAAYARKVGVELSTAKYVLWGEDDLYLDNSYTEYLMPFVSDASAAFGAIYYDMMRDYKESEKRDHIIRQQNETIPFMDWNTLEGYYRFKYKEIKNAIFGHAVYIAPRKIYTKIEFFCNYKVNGYREETDIQLQLRKNGIEFLYNGEAECYHLKNRIDDEKKGGQHKDSRIKQEIYYIINNNIFLDRNYDLIKAYKTDILPRFVLKSLFIKKRFLFNWGILLKKLKRD